MIIYLRLEPYDLNSLKNVLEQEIDRNGNEYEDINNSCKTILEQLPTINIKEE